MKKTMRIKVLKHSVVPLSLCASSVALGQTAAAPPVLAPNDAPIPPLALEPKEQHLNRISMGFQLGFDLKTSFRHIGRFAPATNPGSTNGLSNHFYDDGYNLVDSSNNEHPNGSGSTEGTWNWGYTSTSQINNNGEPGGTLSMHSLSSSGGSSNDRSDDPQPGFTITFGRQLFQDDRDRWRAGLETSFGFTDYSVKDDHAVNAQGSLLTDTYSLMGTTIVSQPNYSQSYKGIPNGTIIGDTPTRTISAMAIPVTGERKFEANLFAFKLGPYFEVPLNRTFAFSLEGGVAMVYVWSNFRFNEEVVTPSGVLNVNGNSNNQGVEFGGYIGARISAALSDQWSLFAGAQWQDVSDYVHRDQASGQSAVLNLSQSVFFSSGITYSF